MDLRKIKIADLVPASYNLRKTQKPGDKEYEKIKRRRLLLSHHPKKGFLHTRQTRSSISFRSVFSPETISRSSSLRSMPAFFGGVLLLFLRRGIIDLGFEFTVCFMMKTEKTKV